jgi:predicted nucleic acid-binding Zn ribbon protein
MPAYDYKCFSCGWTGEILQVPYEERNDQPCFWCGKPLSLQVGFRAVGAESYQMKAVMTDGSHVKGHFGKDAKRKRR